MGQRHYRGVIQDHLFSLLVKLHALVKILLSPSLLQETVNFGVGVPCIIVAALAVKQDVQKILGVRIIGYPACSHAEHLVTVSPQIPEIGRPFGLLDGDVHPQVLFVHLYDSCYLPGCRPTSAGDVERCLRQIADIAVSGFGDEPAGPRRIVGIAF